MERVVICILDGRRVIDKITVKKKDVNKAILKSTTDDYTCIVSKDVGLFLNKYI